MTFELKVARSAEGSAKLRATEAWATLEALKQSNLEPEGLREEVECAERSDRSAKA